MRTRGEREKERERGEREWKAADLFSSERRWRFVTGEKSAAILSPQLFAFFHRSIGSESVSGNSVFNGNVNFFDGTVA